MQRQITIFIAGDSTASTYPENRAPRAGWGQVFGQFFNEPVRVQNAAVSGRSSKSFIDEGLLNGIWDQIQPGDYLFIQFGHNDEKNEDPLRYTDPATTFRTYLTQYIEGARRKGATPILLTPVNRRKFDAGTLVLTHGAYVPAIIELASELQVPLIDMCAKSQVLFEQLGEEGAKTVFLWLQPGDSPNYPQGESDNTHFSVTGAYAIAKLVVQGIRELNLPLAAYLKESNFPSGKAL